jgi:hypothetical protein
MPKQSRKRKKDVNEIAFSMVEAIASGEPLPKTPDGKNPLAVALGRLGGLKGGPARAAKMTAKQRSEGARLAAQSRWKKGT